MGRGIITKMLYVCISFDYELFMGKNYVPEEDVLFKPSEKISKMLKDHGISATFFADVCCSEAYRRLGKPEFADAFDQQLRVLTQQGHDVQLHVHPHWKKATQVGTNVEFPRESYRLHNWMKNYSTDAEVRQIIRNGITYLNRVIVPVKSDYRCLAFRAGGYCLQPEKVLVKILAEEGICIDSSVCRGMAHDGDGMFYDYLENPKQDNVYISAQYGLEDNVTYPTPGAVLEVPVAGYSTFPYRPLASRKNKRMMSTTYRGCGMSLEAANVPMENGIISRLKRIKNATNMITFDFYSADAMIFMLKRLAKENKNHKTYISAIAHPKAQSDEHIENMRLVIEKLQKTEKIKFISMRQIADQLML